MKKVLWLSNFCFNDGPSSGSGSWIEAMGKGVVARGDFELFNVTLGPVEAVTRRDACGVKQWVLPIRPFVKKPMMMMPPQSIVGAIVNIVNEVSPDLIHVWGTERFWGLLTARKIVKGRTLLEMQGIPSAMTPYMTGCLTQSELRKCFGIKELLRPRLALSAMQDEYMRASDGEREIYAGHDFIDYESEWVRSYVEPFAPQAKFFKVRMALRQEFLTSRPWSYRQNNHIVFSSCGWAPNKGLHTLIRACSLLKGRYPDLRLIVAGNLQKGVRRSGYAKWALRELERLDVVVDVLGAIDTRKMIEQLQQAAVYVNPSCVESYSMSLAEAMAVGCPCVASYAGAMPEVGGDACLYFPIADAGGCANRIAQVFELRDRALELGQSARVRSLQVHNQENAVDRQMEIYAEILR